MSKLGKLIAEAPVASPIFNTVGDINSSKSGNSLLLNVSLFIEGCSFMYCIRIENNEDNLDYLNSLIDKDEEAVNDAIEYLSPLPRKVCKTHRRLDDEGNKWSFGFISNDADALDDLITNRLEHPGKAKFVNIETGEVISA